MSLLIDTQSLLWYVLDDKALSSNALAAIESEAGELLVSPASLWEIGIKISMEKYRLDESFKDFWERVLPESDLRILPIEIHHVARMIQLAHIHKDPFDRMIVAQALTEDLTLVSIDTLLDQYGIRRIW